MTATADGCAPLVPDHPVTVASLAGELFAAGLTDAEVADALGIQLADVCRLPEYAEARLGPAHVVRVERELYAAALPGESWREASVAGEIVRLAAYRAPDTAAAKALLAAIEPERYGDRVDVNVTHRYVVELPSVAASTDAWLASLPLAGRGGTPTGGGGVEATPLVPPPPNFQKKPDSGEVVSCTAPIPSLDPIVTQAE